MKARALTIALLKTPASTGGVMTKLTFAVLTTAASLAVAAAAAPASAPPDAVSMTIVETFNPTVGTFTASGGIFGDGTTGTSTGEWFKFDSFSLTSSDHFVVFKAENRITTANGSFSIVFEASCQFITFDPETGDATSVCSGNWEIDESTGAYEGLQGTGSWNEQEATNVYDNTGGGTDTLTGRVHLR
jgi:hypothetical protein